MRAALMENSQLIAVLTGSKKLHVKAAKPIYPLPIAHFAVKKTVNWKRKTPNLELLPQ